MMTFDDELDLTFERVLPATRSTVWRAWTEAALLQRWWLPSPMVARVDQFEPHAGGAFVTSMSEDGQTFSPHTDSVFLVVEPQELIVFTNAITGLWRPAKPAPVAITAQMEFADHADGTSYRVTVRHGSPADRDQHDQLGFFEGWGAVTDGLADVAATVG